MNSRFVLALAVSAGMALLVTGIFYQVAIRRPTGPARDVDTQDVVVAVKDLEVGSAVTASALRMAPWPSGHVPKDAFTEIEKVIGRSPLRRVLADEPVLARRLAAEGSGVGLSPKIPEGMRAMSIRVDDVNGVAGYVLPEAKVDVLITGVPHGSSNGGRRTRTILGNVRVLSAGEQLEPDATGKPQRVPVVTLLLTPKQSEIVTLGQAQGRLQLVLRNSKDEEAPESDGVFEADLYGSPRRVPNVSNPKPEPRRVARFIPPPIEVEMIHGTKRSVASFAPPEGR